MNDTKKLILLLLGAVALIAFAFWLITPLRSNEDIISNIFGGEPVGLSDEVVGPSLSIDLRKQYSADVTTTEGSFILQLYASNAPFTVDSFVTLANENYYDDSSFHRVIKDFVVQTGQSSSGESPEVNFYDEMNADSLGLDSIEVSKAYWLSAVYNPSDSATAEFSPDNLAKYANYTVKQFYTEVLGYTYRTDVTSIRAEPWCAGVANSGPNSGSSQFFIITADAPQRHLDGRYTVFGKVIEGFETITAIERKGAGGSKVLDIRIFEE